MDITLSSTGYIVTIRSFMPQSLYEKLEELRSTALGIDMKIAMKVRTMTIDQIAEKLGPDRAMKIQQADSDAAREVMMEEARQEIISQNIDYSQSISGTHKVDRAQVAGMIKMISRDSPPAEDIARESIEGWLGELPREDYVQLSKAVSDIVEAINAKLGKESGQSSASSSASQPTVPKTGQEA